MKAKMVKRVTSLLKEIPLLLGLTCFAGKATLLLLLYFMNLSFLPVPTTTLIVTDTTGINTSHAAPEISIHTLDNSTFFFDKPTYFRYSVDVRTKEGEEFDRDALRVTMRYFPKITRDVSLFGYPEFQDHSVGRNLIATNDCKTCHQLMGRSTVPTFLQISERYWNGEKATNTLASKIITGGNGSWGEQVMSAHPQLSQEEAAEIVKYILSVAIEKPEMEIPMQGMEILNEHTGTSTEVRYLFRASYIAKGAATPVTGSAEVVLRPAKVEAERADFIQVMQKGINGLEHISNMSYFVLKDIDLKDVRRLTYRYAVNDNETTLETHIDSISGKMVSTANLKVNSAPDKFQVTGAAVKDPGGKHDLYFVFVKNDASTTSVASLDWIKFEGGNEVKQIEKKEPIKAKMGKSYARKKMRAARDTNKKPLAVKHLIRVLFNKSGCYTCHKVSQQSVGPSYKDVAERYKNTPATVNRLVDKIKNGGAGIWGQVQMTPHPQLSREEATEMVRYILSL